ncbi:Dimethylaniline monooxygenase [N-oxide-forming] 2 [Daldinia childiae]|uniref:Dimethylaniline monooxygenase [N-oxide-forming] 2 n=1 Tax=Daldinia childiae TaxID=326645 RepID=UPI00144865A2|nr:Dimethylaniline monooxygenase [N-oxide-forming] 2 [Daldinia childiae]KAF3065168.1 Dimethylaniline monooxygenase [N-oxide-forming] 2 [Daldinia childiae]
MRVAVIGAGPAGLVTLKHLLAAESALGVEPVEARLFESESGVGGTFLARTYEDAELVSSRQLTSFSDFRCKDDEPDFVSAKRYIEYLNDYCTYFNLWPHITLSCPVKGVKSRKEGGHVVTYLLGGRQYSWECDAVAVCSGLHVEPSIPKIEGIERVPVVFHSSQLKRKDQFGIGKTVLILGSGETGADISFLAVTSPTKRVVMCHRDGFHFAPKRNPNPKLVFSRGRSSLDRPQVPIDVSRASLFDTAYVHPWLRNSNALWKYYDCYVRSILWTSWGTTDGIDQWIGGKPKGWTTSEIFFNKSGYKLSPYFNAVWKPKAPKGISERIRSWIVRTPNTEEICHGRQVDLAPWPERIDETGTVIFRDNKRPEYAYMKDENIKPDIVIFCTGYTHQYPFLGDHRRDPRYYEGKLIRQIWPREDPSLGFIGFVRPNLGAIPPLAEFQAQLWVLNLLAPGRVASSLLPSDEPHYQLVRKENARIRYGVDHESYAYQLALDMGSAPSFGDVLRLGFSSSNGGWYKLPLTWALSSNFNTKFRLIGPWKWDGALDIMNTELWDTVARRQIFFGHFTLSFVPMLIFGPTSFVVFLYASLYHIFQYFLRMLEVNTWKRSNDENRGKGAY